MTQKDQKLIEESREDNDVPSVKSLEKLLEGLKAEMTFGSKAFTGNVSKVQDLLEETTKSVTQAAKTLSLALDRYDTKTTELDNQIAALALLPKKNKEELRGVIPELGQEVEKLHSQRMIEIDLSLQNLQKELKNITEDHIQLLKDSSTELCKQIHEMHLQQHEKQEKMFANLMQHTKQEIEAVTSNHGTKFLRNTAISLILAVIMGGVSGWYINQSFPRLVRIDQTGQVTINKSNIEILKTKQELGG